MQMGFVSCCYVGLGVWHITEIEDVVAGHVKTSSWRSGGLNIKNTNLLHSKNMTPK